jgi:hypothetical protein
VTQTPATATSSPPARCSVRALALGALGLALLPGCPTRLAADDVPDVVDWRPAIDPRVPNVGPGNNLPSCAPEAIIDMNGDHGLAFHEGDEWHLRVDTTNRRNDLHPDCADRDSSEAVLRYTAPPAGPDGHPAVVALRISTDAPATQYDTVLYVTNRCGDDASIYSCNNDGFTEDGRETRHSTVYYTDLEPEQYVYIIVDGFDGSAGRAEVIVTEIRQTGTLGQPCDAVPASLVMDPTGPYDPSRCPNPGVQCQPGAAPDGTDLCLPLLPLGAPCDPDERRNVCEPAFRRGVRCAQNPNDRSATACALPGTAPGATCRPDAPGAPRCDGRLYCRPGLSYAERDVCVPIVGQGAACDPAPADYISRCDQGLTCCGDSQDAGASFYCRPPGYSPCFAFIPPPPM